jgi:hypothetical protein
MGQDLRLVNEPLKGLRRKGAETQRESETGEKEIIRFASHFLRFSCMLFFAFFASNASDVLLISYLAQQKP